MNTLSWLIYAAEISERVATASGFLFFILGLVGLFGLGFAWVICIADEIGVKPAAILTVVYLVVVLPLGAMAALLPSSTTVYMIAASEAGEAVVTSEDGQAMLNDLRDIIRQKLEDAVGGEIRKDEEA